MEKWSSLRTAQIAVGTDEEDYKFSKVYISNTLVKRSTYDEQVDANSFSHLLSCTHKNLVQIFTESKVDLIIIPFDLLKRVSHSLVNLMKIMTPDEKKPRMLEVTSILEQFTLAEKSKDGQFYINTDIIKSCSDSSDHLGTLKMSQWVRRNPKIVSCFYHTGGQICLLTSYGEFKKLKNILKELKTEWETIVKNNKEPFYMYEPFVDIFKIIEHF